MKLLGIFEDNAQKEFHLGLIEVQAGRFGIQAEIDAYLTAGCRPHVLRKRLGLASAFDGVVIGVDGGKKGVGGKRSALRGIVGEEQPEAPILWSVAIPSVEEWLMADEDAFRSTLVEKLALEHTPRAPRPGRSSAESTAKRRLRAWSTDLAGEELLDDGREYARDVALRMRPAQLGASRNKDLFDLLNEELPAFLSAVSSSRSSSSTPV